MTERDFYRRSLFVPILVSALAYAIVWVASAAHSRNPLVSSTNPIIVGIAANLL